MFLQLFAPLALVIFYNPSIRKLVFHRSRGINFNTFCGCFFDFISSVVFDHVFLTFGGNLGLHLASIFKKKTLPKMASKKGAPHIKTSTYEHVRRLPGRPPRVRAFSKRNNCFNKKQQFEHKLLDFLFEFLLVLFLFVLFLKMLCQIVFISDFLKTSSKQNGKCQEHLVDDLTRPRPRPGELELY